MKTVNVFDPPQCCATGACGPDQDDTLARFASDLEWLSKQGVQVMRHNLGQDPGAFVRNAVVKTVLDSEGMDSLPMIVIDGKVAKKGGYPSRADLARHLDLAAAAQPAPAGNAASACCRKAN